MAEIQGLKLKELLDQNLVKVLLKFLISQIDAKLLKTAKMLETVSIVWAKEQ